MKNKVFSRSLLGGVAASALLLASAPSYALNILDAWQLDVPSSVGPNVTVSSLTTDIGELSLSGGLFIVDQEVNGAGDPFVGARFEESGAIFSISFVPENVPGAGDFGSPSNLDNGLELRLTANGLSGSVTNFVAATNLIEFVFDPGVGNVVLEGRTAGQASYDTLATLSLAAGGGTLNDFFGAAGTNGNTTIDALITSVLTAGLFRDSSGTSLDPLVASGDLFFLTRTNNEIQSPASAPAPCSFDPTVNCVSLDVASNGSSNIATVPEPGVIALLGVGLFGMGLGFRRRNRG